MGLCFSSADSSNETCNIPPQKIPNGRRAMDILTFLDAVDRTEHHRRLPSSAELTRKVRSAEASLQQEIAACRRRLQSLERMNSEFSNQKRDYTKALMQLQASIDRIIRDKEDLSEQIGALKSELSQLESAKSIDHQPMIQCQIEAAVAQAKSDLNDKLSQTLRRLTEESARKAAMEFAPQLNQLKAKHSSEASVLRTQNATELDRLASQNQRELSRFLSSIRQQFRAQTEQQLELLDRDHANALEQFRRKAERERTRFDADLSRIR
jgi:DNA repair exonuclease SbcCD ATPase subunit